MEKLKFARKKFLILYACFNSAPLAFSSSSLYSFRWSGFYLLFFFSELKPNSSLRNHFRTLPSLFFYRSQRKSSRRFYTAPSTFVLGEKKRGWMWGSFDLISSFRFGFLYPPPPPNNLPPSPGHRTDKRSKKTQQNVPQPKRYVRTNYQYSHLSDAR